MNIDLVKALIKSGKQHDVSLKSGSTIARITFKRINKQGYVEVVQSGRRTVDLYYFFKISNIEAVSCDEPFDFLF
jgi:hypothetical protein